MPTSPSTALAQTTSAELFRCRAQLGVLRAELGCREAELEHLRNQLHSFEGRYIRQVGVLYVQLDQWRTRIAELEVAAESIHETERLLREAQIREALNQPSDPDGVDAEPGAVHLDSETGDAAEPTLRALFRELAKRIHPDFALDARDALHRTQLMAQANDALRRADRGLLQRMLDGHDPARPAAPTLSETLAQIDAVTLDLERIGAEYEALAGSEMAGLRERTQEAAMAGRDLLAEMAAQVKGSIGLAMRQYELDLARIRRRQPRLDPTALLTAERPTT